MDDAKVAPNSPGVRLGGRQKGTPNKLTVAAKEAFQHAYAAIGGDEELANWARRNRGDFYKLFARLIPVEQRIAGSDEESGPLRIEFVRGYGSGTDPVS